MKQPISAHVFNVLTGQNNSYNIELVDMTKKNLYAIGVLILVMVFNLKLLINSNNGISC
jgi:hypothetical protein